MVHSKEDFSSWKKEQLNYFKRYLDNFDASSREYTVLKNGIAELEKSGL